MKIVLVTDDHQTISAHFGRAQFYEIFTIQPIITDIHKIQVAVDAYLAGTLVDHPEKLH